MQVNANDIWLEHADGSFNVRCMVCKAIINFYAQKWTEAIKSYRKQKLACTPLRNAYKKIETQRLKELAFLFHNLLSVHVLVDIHELELNYKPVLRRSDRVSVVQKIFYSLDKLRDKDKKKRMKEK